MLLLRTNKPHHFLSRKIVFTLNRFDADCCWVFSDMQKFPLRMKDNDLLVTELYRDPSNDMVTALSVYLTPKTSE